VPALVVEKRIVTRKPEESARTSGAPRLFSPSAGGGGALANVAVTAFATLIVTAHAVFPEQAPPQPEKTEPGLDTAVSVAVVPSSNDCVHDADPPPLVHVPSPVVTVPRPSIVIVKTAQDVPTQVCAGAADALPQTSEAAATAASARTSLTGGSL